jgi:hypothetical protein
MVNGAGFPTAVREVIPPATKAGRLKMGWQESGWQEMDTYRVLRCRYLSAGVPNSYGISIVRAPYT